MIKITHDTPLNTLNKISVGDHIIDSYDSQGSVVKIAKDTMFEYIEFKFVLDNKQIIYILSSLN